MIQSYSFKIKSWELNNNFFNSCKTQKIVAKTNNIFSRKMLSGICLYPYLYCKIYGTQTEYDDKIFNCSIVYNPYLHFKYTQFKIDIGGEIIPLSPKHNGYIVINIDPRKLQKVNIQNKRRLKLILGGGLFFGFLCFSFFI